MSKPTTKRVRITDRCNQDCIFCSGVSPLHKKTYSKKNIEKQIVQNNGAWRLNITGGEPTICKRLPEFIALAKQTGYRHVSLLTNGNNFADKHYARQLKSSGLTEAIVSVYHFDPEISDNISNTQGAFVQKLKGIKNLAAAKVKITANIVIFSANLNVLTGLVKFLHKNLKIKTFALSMLEPNCKKVRKRPYLVPDLFQAMISLCKAVNYCKRNRLKYYIPYDGAVPPCVFKKYKLVTNKPEEVAGVDFDSSRMYFSFCGSCAERYYCRGTLAEYAAMCEKIVGDHGKK